MQRQGHGSHFGAAALAIADEHVEQPPARAAPPVDGCCQIDDLIVITLQLPASRAPELQGRIGFDRKIVHVEPRMTKGCIRLAAAG